MKIDLIHEEIGLILKLCKRFLYKDENIMRWIHGEETEKVRNLINKLTIIYAMEWKDEN